jgi:hypothetical protein
MPAFRVVVNSASVHGSIGYSTNLFPAMTLGCGAPGGNITSDNIGPRHLMNVKRIAWESRGVEHRTVPADQRMAGFSNSPEPAAVQEKANMPSAPVFAAVSTPNSTASSSEFKTEEKKTEVPAPALAGSSGGVDRAAIARAVENVLSAQGIARGSGASKSAAAPAPAAAAKQLASPSTIAAEIADRFFGSLANAKEDSGSAAPAVSLLQPSECPPEGGRYTGGGSVINGVKKDEPVAKKAEPAAKIAVEIQMFVSENDVRRAMTRSEKIFIGRKTILTPSARDLGLEHEVFVETEAGSIR